MSGRSELLATLELVDFIARCGPMSAERAAAAYEVSIATLKRRLEVARELGAHVESVKVGAVWKYHLANEAAVSERLGVWLELERSRSLV